MISCTEFIYCYNELFKYLDANHGKKAVTDFWEGIRENFLKNLDAHVAKDGIKGMVQYWSHTLGEEGGKWIMSVYKDRFILDMQECPSVRLLKNGPAEKYKDYCEHCQWLYPPLIEKYGFKVQYDIISCETGECRMKVFDPKVSQTGINDKPLKTLTLKSLEEEKAKGSQRS